MTDHNPGPAGTTEPPLYAFSFGSSGWNTLQEADFAGLCNRPRAQRIGIGDALLRKVKDPRKVVPFPLLRDLRAALSELPEPLGRAFDRYVCSVVLVTEAQATGTAIPSNRHPGRSVIVLNLDNLNRSPSEWLSFKQASFFTQERGLEIVATMEEPGHRSLPTLLSFLLIHELGHVLRGVLDGQPLIQRFDEICWPRTDSLKDYTLRPYAALGGFEPIAAAYVESFYEFVGTSCFPSLTAAMRQGEDFADSLANYAHSVLQKRPWRVEVRREGKLVQRLDACWNEPRCRKKRELLELLLAELKQSLPRPPEGAASVGHPGTDR